VNSKRVSVEALALKQIRQHPTLSKAIADVGWGEVVRHREYKASWSGRRLIKIERWYPLLQDLLGVRAGVGRLGRQTRLRQCSRRNRTRHQYKGDRRG